MQDALEYEAMGMSPLKREALGECGGSSEATKRKGGGRGTSGKEEGGPEKRPHLAIVEIDRQDRWGGGV